MIIDKRSYILPEKNYYNIETNKKRIVIGNSFSIDMMHYNGWVNRLTGKYKKTAMYTVTLDGEVFEHFTPKCYSDFTGIKNYDDSVISIVLENEGWLIKDLNVENRYITYVGNIYNRVGEVYLKKWRGNRYWSPYTKEQIESTAKLVKELALKFDIPIEVIQHNAKIANANDFCGVLYRSNLNTYFTDVNPSWNCDDFKNLVENDK